MMDAGEQGLPVTPLKEETLQPLCSICGKEMEKKLLENVKRYGLTYHVYFCHHCTVGHTFPFPSRDYLSKLYRSGSYRSPDGKRFNVLTEYFISLFRQFRRKRIEKFIKRGSLLDIGCGRGLFLHIMKTHGWNVAGIEFDDEIASAASAAYGIPVKAGDDEVYHEFPNESFDVIMMNHVLEHMAKPAQVIAECRRLLKEGGLFVIAVPNITSLQASAGKGVWFHLDVPYHISHYSQEGLSMLLEKHSFRIVKQRHFDMEYNPFGWLQTLLNRSGLRQNLLYELLKDQHLRAEALASAKIRELITLTCLLPFYAPLSFFLSLFESFILRKGGTLELYAIKT